MKTFKEITEKKRSLKKVNEKDCLKEIEDFTKDKNFGKPTGIVTQNNAPIDDIDAYAKVLRRNISSIKSRWTHPIPGRGLNLYAFKETLLPGYRKTFYDTWMIIRFWLPNKVGFLRNDSHIVENDIGIMLQGKDLT